MAQPWLSGGSFCWLLSAEAARRRLALRLLTSRPPLSAAVVAARWRCACCRAGCRRRGWPRRRRARRSRRVHPPSCCGRHHGRRRRGSPVRFGSAGICCLGRRRSLPTPAQRFRAGSERSCWVVGPITHLSCAASCQRTAAAPSEHHPTRAKLLHLILRGFVRAEAAAGVLCSCSSSSVQLPDATGKHQMRSSANRTMTRRLD